MYYRDTPTPDDASSPAVSPAGVAGLGKPARCATDHACPAITNRAAPFRDIGGVAIRTRGGTQRTVRQVDQALKDALASFLRDADQLVFGPAGQAVEAIAMGDYNCRCVTGTNRLSGHAYGRAADIFGWWVRERSATAGGYVDYERLVAAGTWEPLFRVGCCLHLSFGQVLHWAHRGHRNHFHAEVGRKAPGAFWRFQDELLDFLLGSSLAALGWRREGSAYVPGRDVVAARTAALGEAVRRIPTTTEQALSRELGRRLGRPPGTGAGDRARLLLLGTARHGRRLFAGGGASAVPVRPAPAPSPPPAPSGPGPIGTLFRRIREALAAGHWTAALGFAVLTGERDPSKLTNLLFFARHPELGGRKLVQGQPHFRELTREWLEIRDTRVLPYLRKLPPGPGPAPPPTPVSGAVTIRAVRPKKTNSLEAGVKTVTTAPFRPVPGHHDDLVLAATAAAEGGYDTVNLYDRGILSWGLMQWTVHAGSLQEALAFIKDRLAGMRRSALWSELFPGLDIRKVGGQHQLVYRGETVPIEKTRQAPLRRLFRGAVERGRFKDATICGWAKTFALAGRNPVIQGLQREFAHRSIGTALARNLGSHFKSKNYRRVRDYIGGDLRATALFFSAWTQNRTQAFRHLKLAVDRMAKRHGTPDLDRWPGDRRREMAQELERVLRASRFAYWGDAKAKAAKRTSRTEKTVNALRRLTAT